VNDLLKLLRDIFLVSLFLKLWKQLQPPTAFAWQTLILLSLFSWLMSVLAPTLYVREALSSMGWLFLTLGVGWGLSGKTFSIPFLSLTLYPGPWVSGALTCIFLREGWGIPSSAAYVLWPTISAAIASVSKFLKPGPVLAIPNTAARQQIVFWLLSNMIISCWFGFHFLVQDWIRQYPSLLNENYSLSNFVVKVGAQRPTASRGVAILEAAASQLTTDLESRPWAEVERWLLNINSEMAAIETQVKAGLADAEENSLWSLRGQIPPNLPRYTVVLQAIWQGPSAFQGGYYLQRSCLITQTNRIPRSVTAPTRFGAQVRCEAVSEPLPIDLPQPQQTQ
jgi:hypothetical protein